MDVFYLLAPDKIAATRLAFQQLRQLQIESRVVYNRIDEDFFWDFE